MGLTCFAPPCDPDGGNGEWRRWLKRQLISSHACRPSQLLSFPCSRFIVTMADALPGVPTTHRCHRQIHAQGRGGSGIHVEGEIPAHQSHARGRGRARWICPSHRCHRQIRHALPTAAATSIVPPPSRQRMPPDPCTRDSRWKNPCERGKSMTDPLFPADPAGSPRCHWNRRYPNRSSSASPEPCVGEGRWRDPRGRGRARRIYPPLIVVVVIIPPRRHQVHLWIHAEGRGGGVIHAGGKEPAKSAPSLVAAGGSSGLFLPPLSHWSSPLPVVDTCHLGCKRAYHHLPK
uniref:Uncharacterized protein n=1 Tax=Oryza sativa subsp. japonica TaxID=39947 RepID=Q8LMF4_ORYSJ|nr:Hypothetical protein [Oryza sativa Japonica Group]